MMRVVAIALLLAAMPAEAAGSVVLTGFVWPRSGPSELQRLIGQLDLSPIGQGYGYLGTGRWRASFRFSAPATTEMLLGQVVSFDSYDINDGSYLGGDDFFNPQAQPMFLGTVGSGVFQVDRNYQSIIPGYSITYHDFFGGALLSANFGVITNPVAYEFRVDRIGDVPEPATWALLIAGFGLVGAAQRLRRGTPGGAAHRAL